MQEPKRSAPPQTLLGEPVIKSHEESTGTAKQDAVYSRRRFLEVALGAGVAGLIGCDSSKSTKVEPSSTSAARSQSLADIAPSSVDNFLRTFEGRVVRHSDPPYDALRRTWNFKYDKYPGLIAVCATVADVQRTVSFAAEHQVLLSVRSGGHSLAGFSSCDDGIVLVTSELRGVMVDVATQRAVISGGTLVGSVDAELSKYGMATPGAGAATVGYAGFATGGGRGTISPKFGLACDNIEKVDIVTADGQLRTLSATSEPELFWAVRGGGGNFGVATRLHVRAHPLSEVVGGRVVFPFKDASSIIKRIRDLLDSVSDDLYVAPTLAGTPDGPVVVLFLLYCGPKERAEAVLAPYRAVGEPVVDSVSAVPYLDTQGFFPGPPRGTATEGCTGFFPRFTDEVIEAMVAAASAGPADFAILSFSMHGAMADKSLDDTAYPLREKGVDFGAMGFWTSPSDREMTERWARELWASVASATQGAFVNGVFDHSLERARSAYREKYQRLAEIKATYDPTNVFSLNVNVLPAS